MAEVPTPLDELLDYLRRARGFDFTGYKRATLERRIQKRMASVGAEDYAAYLDFLEVRPEEFAELFNTILINVTSFFRDPEVWGGLEKDVLPGLLASKGDDAPLRAWSAGCSSGEEAYTIAMVVAEVVGIEATGRRLKVYATDVDEEALQQARRATYTARDVAALPPGYVTKYFEPIGERFELKKELRHCVIFGRHDLIHDAPISRIDLLTCRNSIMYLNAETQDRILLRMHFALGEGGILVLGKAEMLLSHAELFSPLDLKRRIFVRGAADETARERIPMRPLRREPSPAVAYGAKLRENAFDASPVAQIVTDLDGIVAQISRHAREVFGLGERDLGRPFQDLEVSYRPVELRSAIEQAQTDRRAVLVKDVERSHLGETLHYDVQVAPLFERGGALLGAQISFVDVTQAARLQAQLRRANNELESAFEELQSTSEELETTNEELQSTVEELETTNEELQATNEELETMNEELQATNEEQQTLNSELRLRSDELANLNLSLETILATLRAAVVVVDRDLHVRVWNSHAQDMWGLRADEVVGKNLLRLDIGLPVEKLGPSLRACLAGEVVPDVVLGATNRRGRAIGCNVSCLRLSGGGDVRGAVLVIGEASAAPGT
jgi:two-component system CheB/CheR fusion protein